MKRKATSQRRLIRIATAVYLQPWLIRPEMHTTICDILAKHMSGEAHAPGGIAGIFEDAESESPEITMDGPVAVIPIKGVIGKGVSALEKTSGVTDIDDISDMLEDAMERTNAKAILLDIDSPGGQVTGIPEAADLIAKANAVKPVFAWTDSMADSAAYWLASQATAFYARPSASVGSVGVYVALLDRTRSYDAAGLKVDMVKSGKFKGAGYPGTALSDEQRGELQARVDSIHAAFKAAVTRNRPQVAAESMEGQEFMGPAALAAGLIDGYATRTEAIHDAAMFAAERRTK